MEKLNVAIVGLGFGAEFIPIYQRHPHTNMYAICQRAESKLNEVGDVFGVKHRYTDFHELINDPNIDAVHINSPIPLHAEQTITALTAGKHVACTVPAATTLEDLHRIVEAKAQSGRKYMMMETAVYTREFLLLRQLRDNLELGRIQFLRGSHQQEMAGWPEYWEGLPPMHYATHCIAPCLALADGLAETVSCLGSGTISQKLRSKYGSPFAVETAIIKILHSDLACEVTRSLFETSREYIESFDVYGSRKSFEWQRLEHQEPILFTGETGERLTVPDFADLLPGSIREFTTRGVYGADATHLSFIQGSGHGGSHPHLVHEFVMSILEDREPYPNVFQAANWTAAGLCAHQSAMEGGRQVGVPDFEAVCHKS